jgi:hypothetical protein
MKVKIEDTIEQLKDRINRLEFDYNNIRGCTCKCKTLPTIPYKHNIIDELYEVETFEIREAELIDVVKAILEELNLKLVLTPEHLGVRPK